jgi:hypothetical protein
MALALLSLVGCSGAPDGNETLGQSAQSVLTPDITAYETNGTVTVNYTDMGGAASDWIAIAASGSPATSYIAWKYTGGGASGSVVFSGLPSGGPYVARGFENWVGTKSYTVAQESNEFSLAGGTSTVTTDAVSYAPSATVTVTYAGLPAQPNTWLAIARTGAANNSYLSWRYTGGATSGTATMTAPAAAGNYVVRAFRQGTYNLLDESPSFAVVTGPSVSSPSPISRTTPIAVTFSGFSGAATDWVAVAAAGAPANSYVRWTYTGGGTSGTANLTNGLPAGNYEVRGYFNFAGTHSYTVRASQPLTITP